MLPTIARTMFRIQERLLGRRSFAILKQLELSERWPRERLEELRRQRLQDVLASAYGHTPYWRSVMDEHGIDPEDVRSLDDFRRFPLLAKSTFRQRREEIEADPAAPRGFSAFLGRTLAKGALHLAHRAPAVGIAAEFAQ